MTSQRLFIATDSVKCVYATARSP